jgi:putative hydrolase of the HAD superfamily
MWGKQNRVVRMVTLDALGTLVRLEAPWVHLAAELGREPDAEVVAAVRAEMAYYRRNAHTGRDAESLAALRARCAEVLSRELGEEVGVETMMRSIRFSPYPDARPAIEALRDEGLRLACVSNWDCSLGEVLEQCGLAAHLERVVSSAEAGARKPDPAIFAAALEGTGLDAGEVVHVGDTAEEDVAGARAAGIRSLLIDRDGDGDIASLAEIPERVASMSR